MHISWLGNSAVKLQVKSLGEDVTIVIDPYKQKQGNFPRNLSADIALYTREKKESITISGNPFTLATPGECETKGVLISAPMGHKKGETFLRIDAEKMSMAHLGLANEPLTPKQLETLSDVDILFVPVGEIDCYGARAAVKAIQTIEPKIVIPIAYQSDIDPTAKNIEEFVKEMGILPEKIDKKIIIKKKDLPKEEMRVLILSKE